MVAIASIRTKLEFRPNKNTNSCERIPLFVHCSLKYKEAMWSCVMQKKLSDEQSLKLLRSEQEKSVQIAKKLQYPLGRWMKGKAR